MKILADALLRPRTKVIGIDLAGRETNPSGFAVISDGRLRTGLIYSDEEIENLCAQERPDVVAIDAPLSLPERGGLREADASLIKRGFRVLPPALGGMKSLTERGMRLTSELRAKGVKVIEIHPRTSGTVLFGKPLRQTWVRELEKCGVRLAEGASEHEIDAAIAALTGVLHLWGKTEEVGEAREGVIVIPRGF